MGSNMTDPAFLTLITVLTATGTTATMPHWAQAAGANAILLVIVFALWKAYQRLVEKKSGEGVTPLSEQTKLLREISDQGKERGAKLSEVRRTTQKNEGKLDALTTDLVSEAKITNARLSDLIDLMKK